MDALRAQGGSLCLKDLHLKLRYKRLEKGRFRWPEADAGQTRIMLTQEEVALLLGGIDLSQTRRRAWYRRSGVGEPEL